MTGSGNLAGLGSTRVVLEGAGGSNLYVVGLTVKHRDVALGSQISLPMKGVPTSAESFVVDGSDKLATEVNPTGTITMSVTTLKGKPSYPIKLS